eukprot:5384250-Amphidinium_carterae.1
MLSLRLKLSCTCSRTQAVGAIWCRLESIPTIQLMSKVHFACLSCDCKTACSIRMTSLTQQVIADFGRGELAQSALKFEAISALRDDRSIGMH